MSDWHVENYVVGNVDTNCYFLVDDNTKLIIIVDPGGEAGRLKEIIDEKGYKPAAILVTHAHYDHISGAEALHQAYGVPRIISEKGKETMVDTEINLSGYIGGEPVSYKADEFLSDKEIRKIGRFEFQCFSTPGHTPCGMCFYFPKEMILFSGDTLFSGSVGRTDFPGGSMGSLVRSVREKIMILPEVTKVYPGHGPETDIRTEKNYNPYFGF
jgi:hydroxyacylglutathione hydrolase